MDIFHSWLPTHKSIFLRKNSILINKKKSNFDTKKLWNYITLKSISNNQKQVELKNIKSNKIIQHLI